MHNYFAAKYVVLQEMHGFFLLIYQEYHFG